MRGIILAGGTGSRLGKLTRVVNKHLLPVGDEPMIEWPLHVLKSNCVGNITVVSSPQGVGQLAAYLGSGYDYRVQDQAGGIAQALHCARNRTREPIAVILGDNVFLPTPKFPDYKTGVFANWCFLKEVPSDRISEFGVPVFGNSGLENRITRIDEKPKFPKCNLAVTGLYLFSEDVFDRIETLSASDRGEVEITDLLNTYAAEGRLGAAVVNGFWGDAGTHQGMLECDRALRDPESWRIK